MSVPTVGATIAAPECRTDECPDRDQGLDRLSPIQRQHLVQRIVIRNVGGQP